MFEKNDNEGGSIMYGLNSIQSEYIDIKSIPSTKKIDGDEFASILKDSILLESIIKGKLKEYKNVGLNEIFFSSYWPLEINKDIWFSSTLFK